MVVILYMAVSANGMIAKLDDDTSWISKDEWDSYSLAVRKAKNLIVGRRTYEILTKQPEFSEFKDVKVVIVSKKHDLEVVSSNHSIVSSPKEALKLLKSFKEIIVAGGSLLNCSFLEENLVDEIYLDIEPIIFNEGISLFRGKEFEKKLELIGAKKLSNQEVQLHYKIIK